MSTKEEQLKALIVPIVEALECDFWGLEYLSSGRNALLRVYIDRKETGVDVHDCEKISRQIGSVMDVEDPIVGEYTLEVSSPGMDRPLYTLAQYVDYVGENVAVKLRFPFEGRRNFKGCLQGVEGEDVLLVVDEHEYLFPLDSIEKANIVPSY